MTDDELAGLIDSGEDVEDALHRHFGSIAEELDDWCAVKDEGMRVFGLLGQYAEVYLDYVIGAVAAASAHTVSRGLANQMGLDAYALDTIADGVPPAAGPSLSNFMEEYEALKRDLDAISADGFDPLK